MRWVAQHPHIAMLVFMTSFYFVWQIVWVLLFFSTVRKAAFGLVRELIRAQMADRNLPEADRLSHRALVNFRKEVWNTIQTTKGMSQNQKFEVWLKVLDSACQSFRPPMS